MEPLKFAGLFILIVIVLLILIVATAFAATALTLLPFHIYYWFRYPDNRNSFFETFENGLPIFAIVLVFSSGFWLVAFLSFITQA